MKKRILIFIASRMRDSAAMLVLGELLKKRGHSVAYASPASIGFLLRLWKPHLLFHTHPDMVAGYYNAGLITPTAGPLVAIFPQEGMNFAERDIRRWYDRFQDEDLAAIIGCIFFWNRHEHDWVSANTALRPEQLSISGGMRLDLAKYGARPRPKSSRPRIGFIGRFTHLNRFDGTNIGLKLLRSPKPVTAESADEVMELIDSQYRTLGCYSYLIRKIIDETTCTVSMRGHHAESARGSIYRDLRRIYGERLEIDNGPSVYHWAIGMDLIITTTSTTISEIYLSGTPVLNVDEITGAARFLEQGPLSDASEPIILKCCAGRSLPKSYDELFATMKTFLARTEGSFELGAVEDFLSKGYSWPFARSAIGIIAEKIDALVRGGSKVKRVAPVPLCPKLLGDLFYIYGVVARSGGSIRGAAEIYYNRLIHGTPPYVGEIVKNIERELTENGPLLPKDNRPRNEEAPPRAVVAGAA